MDFNSVLGVARPDAASRWGRDGDLRKAAVQIATVGAWVGASVFALYIVWWYGFSGISRMGYDAHAYWLAGRVADPYQGAPGTTDAFLYSPVFLLGMKAMAVMSWPWFLAVWMAADAAAMWWLLAPLPWRFRGPLLLTLGVGSVCLTNVTPLLGVCLVLAVRYGTGSATAPLLLTKITPAAAAWLWWVGRGEWRPALRAAALAAVAVAASYAVDPDAWGAWLSFLARNSEAHWEVQGKLLLGVLVTVWAARTGRAWLLGVALYLLMPVGLWHLQCFAPLAVICRLRGPLASPEPVPDAARGTAAPVLVTTASVT